MDKAQAEKIVKNKKLNPRFLSIQQGTQEWLDLRKNKVTATDASVVHGSSLWETVYGLWLIKTGKREARTSNIAMLRGSAMESDARKAYERRFETQVEPVCVEHPSVSWAFSSLDGISYDGKIIQEIKCPMSPTSHEIALGGQVPDNYIPQVQWQLFCTPGAECLHYFSYYENDLGEVSEAVVVVYPDLDLQAELLMKCEKFYEQFTRGEEPAGNEFVERAKRYIRAKAILDSAKLECDATAEELISMLPPGPGKIEGAGLVVSRFFKSGTVDYGTMLSDLGISDSVTSQYRKDATEQTRISVSKKLS